MTSAAKRDDNEGLKFDEINSEIVVKTLVKNDSTTPIPVTSVAHISTDLEGNGKTSVGTTAVEVTFTGSTESIIITADSENSGILYIGKSNVATDGSNAVVPLLPAESVTINYEDSSNAIYVVASAASQNFWAGASL